MLSSLTYYQSAKNTRLIGFPEENQKLEKKVTPSLATAVLLLGILIISLSNTITGTNRHIEKPSAENLLLAPASLDQPSQLGTSDPPIIYWNKTYGGASDDRGNSIQQTIDGGYVIAGETWSFGAGGPDFYLVKTGANGDIQWNKTYGGPYYDQAYSVV